MAEAGCGPSSTEGQRGAQGQHMAHEQLQRRVREQEMHQRTVLANSAGFCDLA